MSKLSWKDSRKGWVIGGAIATLLILIPSFFDFQRLFPGNGHLLVPLVGAAFLVILIFLKERTWLFPYLAFLGVALPMGEVHDSYSWLRLFATLPVFVFIAADFLRYPKPKKVKRPFNWGWTAYFIWIFMTMYWGKWYQSETFNVLFQAALVFSLIVLFRNYAPSPYRLRDMMLGAATGAGFVLAYAVLGSPHSGKLSVYPFYENANFFAAVVSMLIPYLVWTAWKEKGILSIFSGVLGALLLLGLFWLESRGALVGMLAGSAVGLMVGVQKKIYRLVLGGFLVASLAFAAFGGVFQGKGDQFSNEERLMRWELAVRMVKEKPIKGIGPGNYERKFKFYLNNAEEVEKISYWFGWDRAAHSEYLTHAAERGLPGLALYLLILMSPLALALKLLRKQAWSRDFVAAIFASIGAYGVHAFFNDLWESGVIYALVAITYAYLQASWTHIQRAELPPDEKDRVKEDWRLRSRRLARQAASDPPPGRS